jgi:RHS repeat-associated protein
MIRCVISLWLLAVQAAFAHVPTRSGALTLTGATPAPASSVTVNGNPAQRYGDFTFAQTNLSLSNGGNTFTIVAHNTNGLTVTNPLSVNLPATNTFQYDANGNLTNDGTRTFAYDGENQLTNVFVAGQWRTDFLYDGLRRRRITREYAWSGNWAQTNEIRYLYDGYLVIQERDSSNTPQVTYTRGLDLSGSIHGAGGIGGLLARTDSSGSTYYHADGAGNVTALMDGNENIVARYEYDPFGKLIGKCGPMADTNRYRFSSKEISQVSGLYSYGFRFYDQTLARWLNRDPMGESGGINLFEPVCNSPLNCVDTDGRFVTAPSPASTIAGELFTSVGEITLESALGWGLPVAVGGALVGSKISEGIGLDNTMANWMLPDVGTAPLPFPANRPRRHPPRAQPAGPPRKPPCPPKVAASAPAPDPGDLDAARRRAVQQAWKQERDLVARTGEGTRDWSELEIEELIENGKVEGYEGHHPNSVEANPDMAGDPNNIQFVTRQEHFDLHGGDWSNPTWGATLSR